jgi:hypothetical protein
MGIGFKLQLSKIRMLKARTQKIAEWNRADLFLNAVKIRALKS